MAGLNDNATFTRLRNEALREGLNPNGWADLCAHLIQIARLDQAGRINPPDLPEGAAASEYALQQVLRFLAQSPFLLHHKALGPLLRLDKAIVDLAEGYTDPIFKPVKSRPGNPGTRTRRAGYG